jgi:hypothetical protein
MGDLKTCNVHMHNLKNMQLLDVQVKKIGDSIAKLLFAFDFTVFRVSSVSVAISGIKCWVSKDF